MIHMSLNPLKTRKSFRHVTPGDEDSNWFGLNPLKTRKSFRLTNIEKAMLFMMISLNPLKTRKSFRQITFIILVIGLSIVLIL